jgi:hypothetical protein
VDYAKLDNGFDSRHEQIVNRYLRFVLGTADFLLISCRPSLFASGRGDKTSVVTVNSISVPSIKLLGKDCSTRLVGLAASFVYA